MGFHEELLPMRRGIDQKIKERKDFLEKRRFNQLSKEHKEIYMTYMDNETPCTKVTKYFNKFLTGELEDFKAAYGAILTEANTQLEEDDGALDDDGYQGLVK